MRPANPKDGDLELDAAGKPCVSMAWANGVYQPCVSVFRYRDASHQGWMPEPCSAHHVAPNVTSPPAHGKPKQGTSSWDSTVQRFSQQEAAKASSQSPAMTVEEVYSRRRSDVQNAPLQIFSLGHLCTDEAQK